MKKCKKKRFFDPQLIPYSDDFNSCMPFSNLLYFAAVKFI